MKEPTKCHRKAAGSLTPTESSPLTGLLSGSCREVLKEPERSKIQQAVNNGCVSNAYNVPSTVLGDF